MKTVYWVVCLLTAEQQNKDIPDQVQVMTYKITELEKTVSTMSAAQMPRLQENITAAFSHVCSVWLRLAWLLCTVLQHFNNSVISITVRIDVSGHEID